MASDRLEAIIRELELRLMTPSIRNDAASAGLLLADDFAEFGSSGQIYDKASVLAALAKDPTPPPEVRAFDCRRLADGVVLVTYRTVRPSATIGGPPTQTLRSSVWRRTGDRWQLVFHQGTRLSA